jgi:hypothetical protein
VRHCTLVPGGYLSKDATLRESILPVESTSEGDSRKKSTADGTSRDQKKEGQRITTWR